MHPAAVARRRPWGVAAAGLLLALAGAPLAVANAAASGIERVYVLDAIVGGLVPAAGALVLSRAPGNRVGWVLASTVGLAVSFVLAEAAHLATRLGGAPWAPWAAWFAEITWIPFLAVLTLLPLWFPTGRVPSRPWLVLQVWLLTLFAALAVACVLHPELADGSPSPLPTGGLPWPEGFESTLTAALAYSSPLCLAALVARHRRSPPDERPRLRWVVAATALAVVVTLLPGVPLPLSDVLFGLAVALVGAAVASAVLRDGETLHHLVDRTCVYGFAAVGCHVLYVVVVTTAGTLLPPAAGFLGVAAVAIAFTPARAAATLALRRFLRGGRSDPLAALATVDDRLAGRGLDGTAAALDAVRASAGLPWVGVLDGGGTLVAQSGDPGLAPVDPAPGAGPRLAFPLSPPAPDSASPVARATREPVGTLVAADTGRPPDERDRALLAAYARTLGHALRAARLVDELRRTREDLVLAREEERRRLHRDLHDGLGPVLSAAVLGLDGVRHDLGASAPPALTRVKEDLRDVIVDLRRLVQDLRPPALDDLGLVEALRRHVDVPGGAGRVIALEADAVPAELPAAVEVAAYRIATEALANALRHAGARTHAVALWSADDALWIRVRDDGRGLGDALQRPGDGVGLRSMTERAELLGGSLTVASDPSGTTVTATLPLRPGPGGS